VAARIILHGHFYQPPRENPWTGKIDAQPSAAPWHDWNERVHAECYRPNACAAIPTEEGERVVNNFERLSFNVGPTLMSWMQKADPEIYSRILDADKTSGARLGHGNALAQAYHHTILPLDSAWDVRTQVRWGLGDFEHRFGRRAEGMWLPETAASDETLRILIEEDIALIVLSPYQAARWRPAGGEWVEADHEAIDVRRPYRYLHPDGTGRYITLFFYDGEVAQSIAFGNLAASAEGLLNAFGERAGDGHLVHAATDGETFGHHHRGGEIGLALGLFVEADKRGLEVTNYAAYLEGHPAEHEVRVWAGAGTSWSCAHGVGRWSRNCGCSTGGPEGWSQAWREPLRAAFRLIKVHADEVFTQLGRTLLHDPWGARDRYVDVMTGAAGLEDWLLRETPGALDKSDLDRVASLLELQRNAMSMFTSCAWFFSDVGGTETVQNLRYAARTLELLETLGRPMPGDLLTSSLAQAKSNDHSNGSAADILRSLSPSSSPSG